MQSCTAAIARHEGTVCSMANKTEWEKMLDCMKKAQDAAAKGIKPEDCKDEEK